MYYQSYTCRAINLPKRSQEKEEKMRQGGGSTSLPPIFDATLKSAPAAENGWRWLGNATLCGLNILLCADAVAEIHGQAGSVASGRRWAGCD
jgi:hypothetical protein